MVGSMPSVPVVNRKITVLGGGSSRVFRKALAAEAFMRWPSAMMATL
jgi:hypothetical protein